METQNTTTKKQRSPFAYGQVVFIEYSIPKKGHFMTVMGKVDGKKIIIGRVFKTYDQELKKYTYSAVDREGNAVFEPTQNLYELKQKFIAQEKTRAIEAAANSVKTEVAEESASREEELQEVRKGKEEKSQELER